MSLHHQLVVMVTVLCISSYMQTVQSQLISSNPFRYGKWGFGACPKVTPMNDFDIRKLYGEPWYTVAHYHDADLLGRHCSRVRFSDSNPGSDICRVLVDRSSVEYDDGEVKNTQFWYLLPNETNHAIFIATPRKYCIYLNETRTISSSSFILD